MSQRKASPAAPNPKRKGAGASAAAAAEATPPQQPARQPSPARSGSPPKADDAPVQMSAKGRPKLASFSPLSKDFWRSAHELLLSGTLLAFIMRKLSQGWENTKPLMPTAVQNFADWTAPKLAWAPALLEKAVTALDWLLGWGYRSVVHFVTAGPLLDLWARFLSRGKEEAERYGIRPTPASADVGGGAAVDDAGVAAGDDASGGASQAAAQQRARERHQQASEELRSNVRGGESAESVAPLHAPTSATDRILTPAAVAAFVAQQTVKTVREKGWGAAFDYGLDNAVRPVLTATRWQARRLVGELQGLYHRVTGVPRPAPAAVVNDASAPSVGPAH